MASAPTYDSASRRSPVFQELLDLLRYHHLVLLLVSKINKTRYKRSSLGVLWTLLNPLLNMTVLTIAFSQLFRFSLPHYPIYVLAALIHWQFFAQVTSYAMNSLVGSGELLKRVYLPRTIFAVSAVGNGLLNLLLATLALAIIMVVTRHPLYPTWWVLPLAVALLAMFALGVALFMCTLAMYFNDVIEMYGVAIQVWFFLTPIIYPIEALPPGFIRYLGLNPMHLLLEVFRTPIYRGQLPDASTMLAAAVSASVALAVGWWVFTRHADQLAYRV